MDTRTGRLLGLERLGKSDAAVCVGKVFGQVFAVEGLEAGLPLAAGAKGEQVVAPNHVQSRTNRVWGRGKTSRAKGKAA